MGVFCLVCFSCNLKAGVSRGLFSDGKFLYQTLFNGFNWFSAFLLIALIELFSFS